MERTVCRMVFFLVATACLLSAQTNTGTISGSVLDQQNAAVAGAKITATQLGTNIVRVAKSSGAGVYTLSNIEPGAYRIVAEADGFATLVRESVTVAASQTVGLDLMLSVGAAATQVTVTADAGVVQQVSSVVQYDVNQKAIEELPLPEQNVLYALATLPGVAGGPGTEQAAVSTGYVTPGSGISLSGGRPGTTQYKADGIENNGIFFGRIALSFSSESVEQMSVQQNSYSAEFGRAAGGIVNMTTKSGTNRLRGMLFSSIQNDALNAGPFQQWRTKDKQRLWRGAANLGGPVRLPKIYDGRNRTFFFAAYEPMRQNTDTDYFQRVPTELEKKGDFSQSVYDTGPNNYPVTIFRQFDYTAGGGLATTRMTQTAGQPYPQWTGNNIPDVYVSKKAQKMLALLPLPNMPLNALGQNFQTRRGVVNSNDRSLFKIDQAFGISNRMYFRMASVPTSGIRSILGKDNPAEQYGSEFNRGTNLVLADTQTWGGNKVNEFRAGFTRVRTERRENNVAHDKNWFAEFGMPSVLDAGFPRLSIGNFPAVGSNWGLFEIDNNIQMNNIFTWVVGRHHLKMGFESQAPQQNLQDSALLKGSWSFSGTYTTIGSGVNTATYPGIGRANATTGFGLAQLLLGFPNTITMAANIVPYQYRWKYYAGFLQDDFRVTPRLTLNLGLRYQVEVPRSEKHHNQGTFVNVPAKTSDGIDVMGALRLNGLAGFRDTMFPTRYNNWEPRIGFAYRAPSSRTMVVRGAYGISHVPTTGLFRKPLPDLGPRSSSLATVGGLGGGYVNIETNPLVLPKRIPEWPADGLFTDLMKINTLALQPDHAAIPYVQQWNFGIGFEPRGNWGAELTYVGSKGTQLFGQMTGRNVPDLGLYEAAFMKGQNLGGSVRNPYGAKDVNGNVANITLQDTFRPNQIAGTIYEPLAQGYNSSYNALQAQLVRRFSRGLQFRLAYTWSKSIDDSSCEGQFCQDNLASSGGAPNFGHGFEQVHGGNRKLERSVSVYDIPRNFTFSYNWDVPVGRGKALSRNAGSGWNRLVGGWKLSGLGTIRSGHPWVTVVGTSNAGLFADYGDIRPNLVPGVPLVNPDWEKTKGAVSSSWYLNTAAFQPAARFSVGNVPRTIPYLRVPTVKTYDMSVLKEVPIHGERTRLQFRADFFSFFNHVNWRNDASNPEMYGTLDYNSYVVPPANSYNSGHGTMIVVNQRQIQLGLKLYF